MNDDLAEVRDRLERPRLNPSFVPVQVDPNTYHVRAGPWTGPVMTITETDEEEEIERLFGMLDGSNHVDDVLAAFDEDDHETILELLKRMEQRAVVYDGTEFPDDHGQPQLAVSRFDDRQRSRLETVSTLIVNAGSVGPQIASDLLDAGVGEVKMAQPLPEAAVEPSELPDDDRFTRLAEGELTGGIESIDAFVYAADREYPALEEELNRTAHETNTPWTTAQIRGFDGMVGPTVYPGETGCHYCLERRIASGLDAEQYDRFRKELRGNPGATPTGLPAYARMVAGYATIDFLHLLAYGQSFTAGRALTINFTDLSIEVEDVLRLPRCPVCGKDRGDDYDRFITIEDVVDAARLNEQYPGE